MSVIMLIMQRKAIVQRLMERFRGNPAIRLIYEPNYQQADRALCPYNANVILIEAAETGPYDTAYCLVLCQQLRTHYPGCKLLLMCPEQNEQNIKRVVKAKWEKQIDDFVFYDVTIDYLVSKIISI